MYCTEFSCTAVLALPLLVIFGIYKKMPLFLVVTVRGGIEDTRLEAKDTKKILGQGQGQPFRGQTLSRPRTGMLEAKDQGHRRKWSPKKRSSKFFSGNLQFIGVPRIFHWGGPKPQITCNDVIKNFQKRNFLWD